MIVGAIPLLMWLYKYNDLKVFFKKAILIFSVIFAVGFPWMLHNYFLDGRFSVQDNTIGYFMTYVIAIFSLGIIIKPWIVNILHGQIFFDPIAVTATMLLVLGVCLESLQTAQVIKWKNVNCLLLKAILRQARQNQEGTKISKQFYL